MLLRRVVCLGLFSAVLAVSAAAFALDKESVYYGNHRKYKKPAEVNAKKVFVVIPEYKEIVDKGIEKDSALYLLKLSAANKTFLKALKKYAKENEIDMICEEGSLEEAPGITDEIVKVIKELTDQE
jgi:hypothetical protein